MIFDPRWWLDLTSHQLDVLRTIAVVVGSGFVPFLGLLLGWGIRLLRATRRDAASARAQTAHVEYVDGQQHTVSVTDYARHAAHAGDRAVTAGEASRQETSDLAEWVRGAGRRRLPTSELPRQEPSTYE